MKILLIFFDWLCRFLLSTLKLFLDFLCDRFEFVFYRWYNLIRPVSVLFLSIRHVNFIKLVRIFLFMSFFILAFTFWFTFWLTFALNFALKKRCARQMFFLFIILKPLTWLIFFKRVNDWPWHLLSKFLYFCMRFWLFPTVFCRFMFALWKIFSKL